MRLIVYSTDGCSICEEVLDKLFALPIDFGVDLRVVDVAFDDDLLSKYGEVIPVLEANNAVLKSPFADQEMMEFIQSKV